MKENTLNQHDRNKIIKDGCVEIKYKIKTRTKMNLSD